MKYYITKYCLTTGISEVEGEPASKYTNLFKTHGRFPVYYHVGTEAFESKEEAIADCESRRQKKIKSIQKQLKKLESLTFKID